MPHNISTGEHDIGQAFQIVIQSCVRFVDKTVQYVFKNIYYGASLLFVCLFSQLAVFMQSKFVPQLFQSFHALYRVYMSWFRFLIKRADIF